MPQLGEHNAETDSKPSRGRINLEQASILLIDNTWGVEILTRIFQGFGARQLHRADTLEKANVMVSRFPLDLIITDMQIEDENVMEFVRRLRQDAENERNRFTPVILLSAHTPSAKIAEARDCGANFFVAKPLSPKIMMDRVLWVAGGKRQYLQTDTYAGPDRRFRQEPLPDGMVGRRHTDPKPSVDLNEPPEDLVEKSA